MESGLTNHQLSEELDQQRGSRQCGYGNRFPLGSLAEYYAVFKHNGLPIIDHRNDDCLLENGVAVRRGDGNICCGYDVRVVQDCVGRDMARFCYSFGDESIYCLNAFPLC